MSKATLLLQGRRQHQWPLCLAITPEGQPKQVVYDVLGWTRNTTHPTPDGITDWNPMKPCTSKELVGFMRSLGKTLLEASGRHLLRVEQAGKDVDEVDVNWIEFVKANP